MSWVQEQIIGFVRDYVDNISDKFKYDKTIMGKVVSVGTTTAVCEVSGEEVTCRIKDGITIAVNDIVIIKVPNNNGNKKYIDGKLKK